MKLTYKKQQLYSFKEVDSMFRFQREEDYVWISYTVELIHFILTK